MTHGFVTLNSGDCDRPVMSIVFKGLSSHLTYLSELHPFNFKWERSFLKQMSVSRDVQSVTSIEVSRLSLQIAYRRCSSPFKFSVVILSPSQWSSSILLQSLISNCRRFVEAQSSRLSFLHPDMLRWSRPFWTAINSSRFSSPLRSRDVTWFHDLQKP